MTTVFKKTVSGAKWVTLGIVINRIINIITFVTLARILAPEIYGIMIATTLIVGGMGIIFDAGYGAILVQQKKNVEQYLNPAWTFEIMKGLFLCLVMVASSPWIAKFFHIEGYELVICFGGLYLFIMGLKNTGAMLLVREMHFGKIFIQSVTQELSFLVVALIWAIFDPTVWALVAGNTALYTSGTIVTYFIHPHRPKLDFHFKRFSKLIDKTKWVIGANITNYVANIIDTTFLGYLLGPASMAIYAKSRDISIMPSSYISQITNKVGFAAIAKVQDESMKIRDGFQKMFDITLMISIPFLVVVWFEAGRIIPLLLGDDWIGMVVPLKLLVLAMTLRGFINITFPIFNGVGKFDIRFKTILLQLITTTGFLVYAVPKFGLEGAAYAVIGSFAIVLVYAMIRVLPIIKMSVLRTAPSILLTTLSAFAVVSAVYPFYNQLQGVHGIAYIMILLLLGLVYLLLVLFLGKIFKIGPYNTVKDTLKVIR